MANAPTEYASAGGQGGILTKRSDLRLYRQAIEGGYNIPPDLRAEIIATAREIMRSAPSIDKEGNASHRDQLSAAKIILAADKLDMEAEKLAATQATTHNHLHLHGETATMSDEAIRARLVEIRDRRANPAGGNGAPRDGAAQPA
jgi:hypothetical protein